MSGNVRQAELTQVEVYRQCPVLPLVRVCVLQ